MEKILVKSPNPHNPVINMQEGVFISTTPVEVLKTLFINNAIAMGLLIEVSNEEVRKEVSPEEVVSTYAQELELKTKKELLDIVAEKLGVDEVAKYSKPQFSKAQVIEAILAV